MFAWFCFHSHCQCTIYVKCSKCKDIHGQQTEQKCILYFVIKGNNVNICVGARLVHKHFFSYIRKVYRSKGSYIASSFYSVSIVQLFQTLLLFIVLLLIICLLLIMIYMNITGQINCSVCLFQLCCTCVSGLLITHQAGSYVCV